MTNEERYQEDAQHYQDLLDCLIQDLFDYVRSVMEHSGVIVKDEDTGDLNLVMSNSNKLDEGHWSHLMCTIGAVRHMLDGVEDHIKEEFPNSYKNLKILRKIDDWVTKEMKKDKDDNRDRNTSSNS